jgi:small subunit ribosomal protein S8
MTMTDPIADMLTRIRNANTAMHDEVSMPSSKQKEALAAHPEEGGLHRGLPVVDANGDRPGAPSRSPQVLARARARDLRHPAGVQARPARVHQVHEVPRVLGGLGIAVCRPARVS